MMPTFAIALFLAESAVSPLLGLDAITPERYPDAHSVTADRVEKVSYRADGSYESRVESWTKVLTEKGRREERTIRLDFSRRYGDGAIEYVGVIGTNGTERTIDIGATVRESTDNGSMAANIYDPLDRKLVATVPGLAIGETLHVRTVRREVRPRCQNQWADIAVFEWSDPIVRSTYEVTVPPDLPVGNLRVRNPLGNMATNVTRSAKGGWIYSFTATNSPQAIPEPDMPALHTQVEHLRISTASDWREISRWYWNLCRPHLVKTSPAMTNRVQALNLGANPTERLRRIFRFVSQEIRYMGLTLEDVSPGYAPHDADLTFRNRYGVCRDKAGLLVAMLRIAGFEAYPVLIQVGSKLDPEVPQPFFNHAIVAIADPTSETGYLLMDPTNESTRDLLPAYLSNRSYLVCRPEGETLRTTAVPDPRRHQVTVRSRGTLAADGSVVLESDLRFGGINDSAYRRVLLTRKPVERERFFDRVVKAVAAGAEILSCRIEPEDLRDTERELRVRLTTRLPECLLAGETRQLLNAPLLSSGLGVVNFLLEGSLTLPQRKYPLVLSTTAAVSETLELELGEAIGAAVELPRAEVKVDDGYLLVRSFSVTNRTLKCERRLTLGAVEFSPKAYGDLREAVKESEAAMRQRPVFAVNGLADANERIFEDRTVAWVGSDTEWTVTNRVIKEILTYEGKKSASELSWSFNPACGDVTLIAATVSNRDGRVSRVTPKEMNLMDAGWAASAPRYAASKQLVVNLPAVEIGSVIDYTVVTTVTNAAAPFYGTYVFDSREPIGVRSVRVNDWFREAIAPRRLKNEPNQPPAVSWREAETVSFNDFVRASERLRQAEPDPLTADCGKTVREIRDWMARNVKVNGPALYELPLALQLTDPAVVLKERYASRLDYVRTLVALLKGAGYEASLVLAADDADDPEWLRRRRMYDKPDVRAYAYALARVREGRNTLFLGVESQYAPLDASAFAGASYLDPATGEFGEVKVAAEFRSSVSERTVYEVHADGSVDLTVENDISGPGVEGFRKTYSEILPELRLRRFHAILGDIAQAATATSELATDVKSHPARRRFSCYIPDYASVQGELISLRLPPLVNSLPTLTGTTRATPLAIAATEAESETVVIRFPKDFTRVEQLPESFVLADPENPDRVWMRGETHTAVNDGVLSVTVVREVLPHRLRILPAKYHSLLKDWNRRVSAAGSRTVIVRRK